jgi:hypothetical protein
VTLHVPLRPQRLLTLRAAQTPDQEDQRSKRVKFTRRGHAVIHDIREIVAEVETESETQLGAASFAQLRDLVTQLRAIASTPPPQPPATHQP